MNTIVRYKFIFLSVIALSISCTNEKKTEEAAEEKPLVKLETVSIQAVDQTQEFTATVEANKVNNIAPSTPVRIDKILVEVGDRVRKGQKLVEMDIANLEQSKTQLENLQLEFNRIDELYKVGGTSKSAWDAQKTSLDIAKTAYKNLEENTRLLSPIDGVVTARNYDDGDMYSATNPVITVEQITPVKLLINVSEAFYTKVKEGMDVDVKLDVYGDEQFKGKVSLLYPTIDPQTRTFTVEVKIPNADKRVRPGMFARVVLNFGTLDHVVVPDRAVIKQSGSGDRYIYVYNDGKVSYNKVQLGRRMDDKYEVISGVKDRDKVVVSGQNKLTNGAEVEVGTN
ncbi:MAG: efflux RND transporter periplasmic adaptor subunit [Bacteroidaceae bacterium]|nr:efflux RND transporter periplasmic adaptor subunit [Bacteroidaceae bacterium]